MSSIVEIIRKYADKYPHIRLMGYPVIKRVEIEEKTCMRKHLKEIMGEKIEFKLPELSVA